MATVNLNDWSQFRKSSLELSDNLKVMVGKGDSIIASDDSDAVKITAITSLVQTYLPT